MVAVTPIGATVTPIGGVTHKLPDIVRRMVLPCAMCCVPAGVLGSRRLGQVRPFIGLQFTTMGAASTF